MAISAGNRWEVALGRLRLALIGDSHVADILDQSRARIFKVRETLERASLQRRRRPFVQVTPMIASTHAGGRDYFAVIFDTQGIISTHRLLASDDGEATARARIQADEHAFDVWEGWRFIGCSESQAR